MSNVKRKNEIHELSGSYILLYFAFCRAEFAKRDGRNDTWNESSGKFRRLNQLIRLDVRHLLSWQFRTIEERALSNERTGATVKQVGDNTILLSLFIDRDLLDGWRKARRKSGKKDTADDLIGGWKYCRCFKQRTVCVCCMLYTYSLRYVIYISLMCATFFFFLFFTRA